MKVAFTGPRRLTAPAEAIIRDTARRVARQFPEAMIFGGALGADTVALEAADAWCDRSRTRLVVIVPGTVDQQPRVARLAIRAVAPDEVIELGLPIRLPSSYHTRNRELVARADRLVAFVGGSDSGTRSTIRAARQRGIPVEEVQLPRA